MGFFQKGFKIEFKTAVVNEPSVFEPLKFYCILHCCGSSHEGKAKRKSDEFLKNGKKTVETLTSDTDSGYQNLKRKKKKKKKNEDTCS